MAHREMVRKFREVQLYRRMAEKVVHAHSEALHVPAHDHFKNREQERERVRERNWTLSGLTQGMLR